MEERYPLEAARALRAAEEDARTRELAEATRALELAGAALLGAREDERAHREHTARVREDELERDARGRAAHETTRAQDWLARRRSEGRALAASIETAAAGEREARAALDQARARLATARAEREALEKHFARWSAARAREAERRDEDEADERRR